MVKVQYFDKGVESSDDKFPFLSPEFYNSNNQVEFVQFDLNISQPIAIGGINLDPMNYNWTHTDYWAFRVGDSMCSSMQYSLTLELDFTLNVECDTTSYPQMLFNSETYENEWQSSEFLTTSNYKNSSLWMFNKSEDTFTVWNVMLDGTTKLAPYVNDSYFLSRQSNDSTSVEFDSQIMISWPKQNQLENTPVASNVLFIEDQDGKIRAFKPQASICGDLRMVQNYIAGNFVLYCTAH